MHYALFLKNTKKSSWKLVSIGSSRLEVLIDKEALLKNQSYIGYDNAEIIIKEYESISEIPQFSKTLQEDKGSFN